MRWTPPKENDKRVIRKFLWWPLAFGGESCWLEHAEIEQVFRVNYCYKYGFTKFWEDMRWARR